MTAVRVICGVILLALGLIGVALLPAGLGSLGALMWLVAGVVTLVPLILDAAGIT